MVVVGAETVGVVGVPGLGVAEEEGTGAIGGVVDVVDVVVVVGVWVSCGGCCFLVVDVSFASDDASVEEGSSKLLASVSSLSLTVWLENRLRTKSMIGRLLYAETAVSVLVRMI